MRALATVLLLFTVLAGCTRPAPAETTIIGYLPSIRGIDTTLAATDITPYSQITLSFINPDGRGDFTNGTNMACMTDRMLTPVSVRSLSTAVATIHARNKRAVGSLGGALLPVCSGNWIDAVSAARRGATVASLVALADDTELDGLDVDFEGSLLASLIKAGTYTPFITALSRSLHAHHKTLSGTTASYVGGMIPLAAISAFDQVEVMAYEGSTAGQEEASFSDYSSQLYFWLGRGVAKDKLVLGVPFYANGYGAYQNNYSYRDLVAQFGGQSGDHIGEVCATCSYVTFNGPVTLRRKAALAKAKASGVLVWEISQDTPDGTLIKAVVEGLRVPQAAANSSPETTSPTGAPLNTPDVRSWTIIGAGAPFQLVSEPSLPRGNALQITVPKPTENAWDVGVTVPIRGAIRAGDHITFAAWVKLNAPDADTQLSIPATVQLAEAPYSEIFNGSMVVTTQWQLLHISGIADKNYAAGATSAALSVGGAAKVIEFGPAFITDQGR